MNRTETEIVGTLLAVLHERGVLGDGDVRVIIEGAAGTPGPLAGNTLALTEALERRLRK